MSGIDEGMMPEHVQPQRVDTDDDGRTEQRAPAHATDPAHPDHDHATPDDEHANADEEPGDRESPS